MRGTGVRTGMTKVREVTVALLAVVLLAGPSHTFGSTIRVDQHGGGDYLTIQEGLDAAASGDTVLVAPGTYYERLTTAGPTPGGITLLAAAGPESTIIDGQDMLGAPLLKCSDTYYGFTVSGFTFAHGRSSVEGAAIRCYSGTVSIINNVIRDNEVIEPALGGSVALMFGTSTALISGNRIHDNQATSGAGVLLYFAEATVTGNHIFNNVVIGSGNWSWGGGIAIWNEPASLLDNRIESNQAWSGAGIHMMHASGSVLSGNTVAGNVAAQLGGGLRFLWTRLLVEGNVFSCNDAASAGAVCGNASEPDSCIFVDNVFFGNTAANGVSIDFLIYARPRFRHNYFGDPCSIQLKAPMFDDVTGTMLCRENWWGTTDPEEIAARIYDCSDSVDYWCVDYSSWCDDPTCEGTVTGTPGLFGESAVSWGRLKALFAD